VHSSQLTKVNAENEAIHNAFRNTCFLGSYGLCEIKFPWRNR